MWFIAVGFDWRIRDKRKSLLTSNVPSIKIPDGFFFASSKKQNTSVHLEAS